jgi:uncharacterized protein
MTKLQISKNIELIDLALYIKPHNALVISDVHIGYEESLNKQGILIPRLQFKQIMQRIENILKIAKNLDYIIINGDLKHEFGKISNTEWHQTLKFIDFLTTKTKKIILLQGNHDTIIKPIAKKRNLEIVKEFSLSHFYFCHGDIIPKTASFRNAKTIIIGHEHPAICFREETRKEKFKCFLFGKYKRKNLIVLPAFNPIVEGTDILEKKHLTPFLQQNIKDFKVYISSNNKILYFKKVKDIENVISTD